MIIFVPLQWQIGTASSRRTPPGPEGSKGRWLKRRDVGLPLFFAHTFLNGYSARFFRKSPVLIFVSLDRYTWVFNPFGGKAIRMS
jgi:hypothetical protein